jgi:hypothetical protein
MPGRLALLCAIESCWFLLRTSVMRTGRTELRGEQIANQEMKYNRDVESRRASNMDALSDEEPEATG